LSAWAKELGRQDCATVLAKNLDEEKAADQKLTKISESRVNAMAACFPVYCSKQSVAGSTLVTTD
jgi:ferritin-like metal-binding protein YciE